LVRFQVTPAKNQLVRSLNREEIEIREDGVAQPIAVFEGGSTARTIPVEVSLLFDCSASVQRASAPDARLIRDSLLDEFPNVSIAVYGFSDSLVQFAQPTRDANVLRQAIGRVNSIPAGETPLFGSIADTIRSSAANGSNVVRKLVVFSDGESEWPGDEARTGDVVRAAKESGTAVFPVMLNKAGAAASAKAVDSVREFMSLGPETGGRGFQGFMGTDVLPIALKSLAHEIRSDYVAGFYVSDSPKRKAHEVQVVLRSGDAILGGTRIVVH
jgi:VWFA-related protein